MGTEEREDRREHGCRTAGTGRAADPPGVDCGAGTGERLAAATCSSSAAAGAAGKAAASGQYGQFQSQATRVRRCRQSAPVGAGLGYVVAAKKCDPSSAGRQQVMHDTEGFGAG